MGASVASGDPKQLAHVSEGPDEPTQSITDIGRTQNRVHGSHPAPVGRHMGGRRMVCSRGRASSRCRGNRTEQDGGSLGTEAVHPNCGISGRCDSRLLPLHSRTQVSREHGDARGDSRAARLAGRRGPAVRAPARGPGARVLATCCIAALVGGTLFHAPILRSFGMVSDFGILSDDEGLWLTLSLLGITLVSVGVTDFVDRKFDSSKVAPGMRPNRTWKGAAAGVLGAVLFGVVLPRFPGGGAGLATAAVAAATLGVAAQLADLFFERLKRQAADGDSAWTFPGWRVLDWMFPVMWTVVVLYHFVAGFSGSTA